MSKVKINILSPGRFHVCDLARELDRNGYDVHFYSFVPERRAAKFGLPRRCSKSLIGVLWPFLLLEKKIFKKYDWARRLRIRVQDFLTAHYMRKCDVCIAMSGSFLYAPKVAKRKGAKVILERGSKHILEQKRILESIPGWGKFKEWNVKRELEGYQIADYIALGSQHCYKSFLLHNYPSEKLFVNNYGVDLSMFYPISGVSKEFDAIMVGGWTYQKGCDLIIQAIRMLNLRFIHVGGIGDVKFPVESTFTHIDPVDQSLLVNYYNKAKIFIIPSRQEGLAMVQAQAIACNLPIVGSPDSGAEDLKMRVENPDCVVIIKDYTVDAVCEAIQKALRQYELLHGKSYAGNAIKELTWAAYGDRYAEFLQKIFDK